MVLSAASTRPVLGASFGAYSLLREIGRGGMAVVFEAEDAALHRRVAVKVLQPRGDAGAAETARFLREAEAAARLTHPVVVRVFGRGIQDGTPYIVTELVPGARDLESLWQDWSQNPAALPDDHVHRVAGWFAELADAVAEAHRAGVLHRDLKPANLLLDETGRIRLVDFGLASIQDQVGLSQTGVMSGTPLYMCPEQVRSTSFSRDHRADVYSLGASLYQMLGLQRPFAGETAEQVFHAILHRDPTPLRKLRPSLPAELTQVCAKAMEKDPRLRYPSMAAFAADLRRFLRHEPVQARPPSSVRRLRTWFRRHPRLGVALLLGAVSLAALGESAARLASAEAAQERVASAWDQTRSQRHAILVRAAAGAVAGFRFGDARELLALTEPGLRDWTVRHLSRQLERQLLTLQPPGGPRVLAAAVHPEGRYVVAGFGDGSLRWWNALSEQAARELDRFEYGVYAVAFSPDGHWLAAGGDDCLIRLYDTETLRVVREYREHLGGVGSVCFSPDGRQLLSADDLGAVHRWDRESGARLQTVQVEPRAIHVAFSPDGAEFTVADGLGGLSRFSSDEARPLGTRMTPHAGNIFDFEYQQDGQGLWSCSLDGSVRRLRWTGSTPAAVEWSWQGDSALNSMAAARAEDGAPAWWLGSKDGHLRRLRADGTVDRRFPAHFAFANVVRVDPRGRWILSGGDDGAVQLWRPEALPAGRAVDLGGPLRAAAVDTEAGWLLLRRADGRGELRRLEDLQPVDDPAGLARAAALPIAPDGRGPTAASHPDEAIGAVRQHDGRLRVEARGEPAAELLELPLSEAPLLELAWLPELDGLLAVQADGRLQFWGTAHSPWPPR